MIGTSSSSSAEAWLVHPDPDTWLTLSASPAASLGLASPAAPGGDEAAWPDGAAASAADEELQGAAAAPGASALAASLWGRRHGIADSAVSP